MEKENIFKEVTNSREGKGGIIWRGKINVDANRSTDISQKPTNPMCTYLCVGRFLTLASFCTSVDGESGAVYVNRKSWVHRLKNTV